MDWNREIKHMGGLSESLLMTSIAMLMISSIIIVLATVGGILAPVSSINIILQIMVICSVLFACLILTRIDEKESEMVYNVGMLKEIKSNTNRPNGPKSSGSKKRKR